MQAIRVSDGKFKLVVNTTVDGRRIRKTKMLPGNVADEAEALRIGRVIFGGPNGLILETLSGLLNLPSDPGAVYFAKNAGHPGVVKIGMTRTSVWDRMRNLSTAQPKPWTLIGFSHVRHAKTVESILHQHFSKQRIVSNREFFTLTDDVAIQTLSACDAADGISMSRAIGMIR